MSYSKTIPLLIRHLTLLILLINSNQLFSQSLISFQVKDGEFISEPPNSFPNNTSRFTGPQRTFVINDAITLTVTTIQPSCGNPNGSIIVVASGGTAPYTYTRDNFWFYNTGNFPRLTAGNYTITVTDATGQTATATITLANTLPPVQLAATTVIRVSACNAQDGSVTLAATGGAAPYEFSLDMNTFQASNTFSNLAPGAYTFFVKDANGCITSLNGFNIMNQLSPTGCNQNGLSLTFSVSACTNEGTLTANAGAQNGPFTYSLDGINYQLSGTFNNLTSGVHTIYYKNVLGNVAIFAVTIQQSCNIDLSFISVDAACQQNDGVLTVTAVNGATPYTYTLDGVNYQSSNVFTGLAPGNYFVTVRDNAGFTSSQPTTLYDRCPALTLTATGESCLLNDGTIIAIATKGTSPYTYSLDGTNFQNSNVFTGLAAGPYTITLKDALGFTTTATITVSYNCLTVTAVPTHVICSNVNGVITATGANGTPPYQYSIDGINFQSSNTFTGLFATTYTVTIKDAAGLTATTSVTINNSPNPVITVSTTPATCPNNNGVITLTATGGLPPITYSIDGINFVPNNVFNNIVSGPYTVAIRDANGCGAGTSVSVIYRCPIISTSVTHEVCGAGNGTITVTVTAGGNSTPPYTYSLDGTNFQSADIFNSLAAGTYTVTVKDALGYSNTATVTINNGCPTVTATAANSTCGNPNGSITATGANGTAPYQYSVDGINYQSNPIFSGLPAGNYTVTIKDAVSSTNTTTTTISDIAGPQVSATPTTATCLNNDGTITLSATGGTAPFQYSLDGTSFQAGTGFTTLSSGNYTGYIKDANGCISSQPVTITGIDNLALEAGADITICEGKTAHIIPVSNAGGFLWTPAATLTDPTILDPVASPVTTTKYYIKATLGICTLTDSVTIHVNPAPVPVAGNGATICKGQDSQLNGSGGLDYIWTPSTYLSDPTISNPDVLNPLSTITYQLQVTDANGCTSLQSSSVTISITTDTKVFAGNDTSIVMNQPFNLLAADLNNSGFVQFTWTPDYGLNDPSSQQPVTILDREITYLVTAFTANGCSATDEIKIKVYKGPEIYVPNAFTPDDNGLNDILFATPVGIKKFKHFVVFNRGGQRIFYTTNPAIGWDGKNKGIKLGTEIFVWMAEGTDDAGKLIQRKGTVTLIR